LHRLFARQGTIPDQRGEHPVRRLAVAEAVTALGKLIQYALLAGVLVIVFVFIRGQHGVRMQASKRLAFFAFALLNVYAVLRPDDVTRVAKFVGVGRGTDLLLYALIVA